MKIEIIGTGMGPILSNQKLDELFFGTSTLNKKNPLEEAMDKLLDEVRRGEAKTIMLDSLGDITEEIEKDAVGKYSGKPICFDIQSIIANHKKNAFTVVWGDGSHTIVHLQKGDVWDDEKALAMCFVKHMMGDKGNFNDIFTEELPAKLKTIPAEPVPEKACDRDGTCEKCECKAEAEKFIEEIEALKKEKNAFGFNKQTATELSKAANKASNSLKEMIDALTGETVGVDVKPVNIYKVFIRISGKSHFDSEHLTIESLRERVHEIAEEYYGRKPYYYRTWIGDNGRMIIDFGHYSKFIEVEGITPSEYAKN